MGVDLENRDPNRINDHLQCQFEDIIAEPDGTRSLDCLWRLSYTCFSCWKSCCYNLSAILCGICIAAYWGCEFAYVSFVHIWLYTPCFKEMSINCGCCKKIWHQFVACCCEPVCVSCGEIFHAFKKN